MLIDMLKYQQSSILLILTIYHISSHQYHLPASQRHHPRARRPAAGWIAGPPRGPPSTWPGSADRQCVGPGPAVQISCSVAPMGGR